MSAEGLGPAVQRALLTQELKRLRTVKKETQEQVAEERGWSASKFIRIENGTSPVSKSDLEGLLRHYGEQDPDRVNSLLELAQGARDRGWWLDYYDGSDKAFEAYLGYEDGASTIRMFQGLTIPGLLQTEAYIRELGAIFKVPPATIERSVKLRLERQRRVAAKAPKQYYIIDEAILRRPVGDVMPDQLRHLLLVADKPAVSFRIIPMKVGLHFGLRGSFVLLGFGELLEDILYLEGARRGDLLIAERESLGPGAPYIEQPAAEVGTYIDGFNELSALALEPAESMALIEESLQKIT